MIVNIQNISRLDEKRLLVYLECYDNQFLYQKTGFLLKPYRQQLSLSDQFFEICKEKIGLSKRYLTKDCHEGKYDGAWRLIIPLGINTLKNGV